MPVACDKMQNLVHMRKWVAHRPQSKDYFYNSQSNMDETKGLFSKTACGTDRFWVHFFISKLPFASASIFLTFPETEAEIFSELS